MDKAGHIGVDCGGTQCRIVWERDGQRETYVGRGANFSTNADACADAVHAAVRRLADRAGVSFGTLCDAPAYLSIAGILSQDQADALVERLPFQDSTVEDDRRANLRGALGMSDGFIAALGTGSFFARQVGGEMIALGGHGLALGDEASAAWLGRNLLRMTLHADDGLTPHSPMTEAVLDEMGGAVAIVDFASDAVPAEYGRLAPGIAGAAQAGDPQGRVLMRTGAEWITRGLTALGWTREAPVVLTGALGAAYQDYLPPDIAKAVQPAEGSALDGALALAKESAT